MRGRDPVNGRLHFAPIRRIISSSRRRVIRTVHFHHLTFFVFHNAAALDEVRIAQPNLLPGRKPEVLRRRNFPEVILLDVKHPRERHLARARIRVFGIIHRVHLFDLVLRVIIDNHFQRPQHRHHPSSVLVQIFAHEVLEHRQLDHAIGFRSPDRPAKIANGIRGISATADADQRRHTRVVPATYVPLLHQLQQLALAQECVGEVQPVELNLLRRKNSQLLDEPVVQRTVILKLQRAHGMRDPLE